MNPTLNFEKGRKYTFNLSVATVHPFRIVGDVTAPFLQSPYVNLDDCVSCVTGDDRTSGLVTFFVPVNPTSVNVGFQCINHGASEYWKTQVVFHVQRYYTTFYLSRMLVFLCICSCSAVKGAINMIDPVAPTPSASSTSTPSPSPTCTPSVTPSPERTPSVTPSFTATSTQTSSVTPRSGAGLNPAFYSGNSSDRDQCAHWLTEMYPFGNPGSPTWPLTGSSSISNDTVGRACDDCYFGPMLLPNGSFFSFYGVQYDAVSFAS